MNTPFHVSIRRRVLLAVTGLSPQIVTETLYALCVAQATPWIPDEVHLITTREGAERARLLLLSGQIGWFHRFCRDYQTPDIRFDASHIHVLAAPDGSALDDIRTPEENLLAADFITEQVRAHTADPETALHVSIAGGRKTMGFFLGYALSLFGRDQDRLSHVLVSSPFESNWNFFYPTPCEHILEAHDKKPIDARDARVSLAEIPFVSLRHGLPAELLTGRARYAETVRRATENLGPVKLEIDLRQKRVRAGSREIPLSAAQLALLALLARRAREGAPPLPAPKKDVGDTALSEAYLAELDRIHPDRDHREQGNKTYRALKGGMDGDHFSQALSKLKASLRRAWGADGANLIDDGGERHKRYRLAVAPENIRFV